MNRYLLALQLIIFSGIVVIAQYRGPTNFRATLYVTDTVGNVDSVTVEAHPEGTNELDTQLGEIKDMSPLDTILDVRVVVDDSLFKHYVRLGSNSDGIRCLNAIGFGLVISATHQPVTITWDSSSFRTECQQASFLTNNTRYITGVPSPDAWTRDHARRIGYSWACLAVENTYTVNTSEVYDIEYQFNGEFEYEVIGGEISTFYQLTAGFTKTSGFFPCTDVYRAPVSVKDLLLEEAIINVYGDKRIEVSGLKAGTYDIEWYTTSGSKLHQDVLNSSGLHTVQQLEVPSGKGPAAVIIRDRATRRIARAMVPRI